MTTTVEVGLNTALKSGTKEISKSADAGVFMAHYNRHLEAAGNIPAPEQSDSIANALLEPLSGLNGSSVDLSAFANSISGSKLAPSQLMELSLKTHEFVFRCQITATVANRSGEGVQQLFRQQT